MKYLVTADTDIGISKKINQDSLLIKHAKVDDMEVLMAIVCDGMGGLSKGELASATVIKTFSEWFDEQLPYELDDVNMEVIGNNWSFMLKDLNAKINEYGNKYDYQLGTTFSGILFIDNQYVIVHVGDSRVYRISNSIEQLTTDHTFVQREISAGTMTLDQAKVDKRRNLLLQCVGASKFINPDIIYGKAKKGAYLLCSDGFRHEISEKEMFESLNPVNLINKTSMHSNAKYLIELVKSRNERDNISAIIIKAE